MNIYLIINHYNVKNNIFPYLYIGSDTKDRVSMESYPGSSKHVKTDIESIGIKWFSKHLLWQGSMNDLISQGFTTITQLERSIHILLDVVKNPIFYNAVLANEKFNTNNKATYYHVDDPDKKLLLLPTDDPRVISGVYIGRNTGMVCTDATREKLRERPHPSSFFTNWGLHLTGIKKKSTENYKKPKSEKHKQNLRKPKNKSPCPYCNLMCAPNVIERHIKARHEVASSNDTN